MTLALLAICYTPLPTEMPPQVTYYEVRKQRLFVAVWVGLAEIDREDISEGDWIKCVLAWPERREVVYYYVDSERDGVLWVIYLNEELFNAWAFREGR